MKKAYSKPQILFDSFELSQNIAAGCVYIATLAEKGCPVDLTEDDIGILFADNRCSRTPGSGEFDQLCYDVPSDNFKVFTS